MLQTFAHQRHSSKLSSYNASEGNLFFVTLHQLDPGLSTYLLHLEPPSPSLHLDPSICRLHHGSLPLRLHLRPSSLWLLWLPRPSNCALVSRRSAVTMDLWAFICDLSLHSFGSTFPLAPPQSSSTWLHLSSSAPPWSPGPLVSPSPFGSAWVSTSTSSASVCCLPGSICQVSTSLDSVGLCLLLLPGSTCFLLCLGLPRACSAPPPKPPLALLC